MTPHAPITIGAAVAPDERFEQALEYHRQHNHAEAGKIYREILRENSGHVGAMHNLIDVLCAHEGRRLEAIPLAERLVSLFPESADVLHRLGWLYGEMVAAMRKLITVLNVMIKNGTSWNEQEILQK